MATIRFVTIGDDGTGAAGVPLPTNNARSAYRFHSMTGSSAALATVVTLSTSAAHAAWRDQRGKHDLEELACGVTSAIGNVAITDLLAAAGFIGLPRTGVTWTTLDRRVL